MAGSLAPLWFSSWLPGGVVSREKRASVPPVDGTVEGQVDWWGMAHFSDCILKQAGNNTGCENIIKNLQNQHSSFLVNTKGLAAAPPSHVFGQLLFRTSHLPLWLMGTDLSQDWHSSPLLDRAMRFSALKSCTSHSSVELHRSTCPPPRFVWIPRTWSRPGTGKGPGPFYRKKWIMGNLFLSESSLTP